MDKAESKRAIILGNGESRKGFDYRKEFPDAFVYGCNGAYKEEPDALICVDVGMQHILYDTGYPLDHLCYFSEWDPVPGDVVEVIVNQLGLPVQRNVRGDRNQAVISGTEHMTYVTWVEDEDKVISIPEVKISSGSRALLHACESEFEEIFLLGFDGMGATNLYQQDPGYERSEPREEWIRERAIIKGMHSNITFHEINTI